MKNSRVPGWFYALLLMLAGVVVWRVLAPGAAPAAHPDPRASVTAVDVVAPARFAADPQIARVYAMAARVPNVLDGLYCYCECARHSDHRSLLTCFESDHGSMCDICLGEAALAFRMAQEGASLEQIRAAIDARFG
jgi:hypothetical protein